MKNKRFNGVEIESFINGTLCGIAGVLFAIVLVHYSGLEWQNSFEKAIVGLILSTGICLFLRYKQNIRDGRKWWV